MPPRAYRPARSPLEQRSLPADMRWLVARLPNPKLVVGIGQAGPGQSVRRLLVEGLVKASNAFPQAVFGSLVPVVAPIEAEAVGVSVLAMALCHGGDRSRINAFGCGAALLVQEMTQTVG